MPKGLPRSRSRGAPLNQQVIKTTLGMANRTIEVDGATGVGFGTVPLIGFPQGNILLLGIVSYIGLSTTSTDVTATFSGDYGIGTTPADDGTLSAGDVDLIASTALGPATARVIATVRAANAVQAIIDNTAGDLEMNLNVLIDDADISADDVVLDLSGSVHALYSMLGDD